MFPCSRRTIAASAKEPTEQYSVSLAQLGPGGPPGDRCHLYGEGEWKIRKHGKAKQRLWHKLYLAVDAQTHAIVAAEVSLGITKSAQSIAAQDKAGQCRWRL